MRKTKVLTRASWIVDPESIDRNHGRQVAWEIIPAAYREGAVNFTLTANAAQGATSIAVSATLTGIAAGDLLYFSGTKIARVTAYAKKGSTVLSVEALPTALVSGDVALFGGCGKKFIPSGCFMQELTSGPYTGKVVPKSMGVAGAVDAGLIISDANFEDPTEAKTGYGMALRGVVFENLLPDASGTPKALPAGWAAALQSNGLLFRFERYVNSIAP